MIVFQNTVLMRIALGWKFPATKPRVIGFSGMSLPQAVECLARMISRHAAN